MNNQELFLQAVIGPYGLKAMKSLREGSVEISQILVPRAAYSWVQAQSNYNAEIPGVAGSVLRLKKSQNSYSGEISIDSDVFSFQDAPLEQIAAAIIVSLGVKSFSKTAKSIDLARLGKTIDMLVSHRQLQKYTLPPEQPGLGGPAIADAPTPPAPVEDFKENKGKPEGKQEGKAELELSEEESNKKCDVCGGCQVKDSKFKGCHCLRGLSKSVKTEISPKGYKLTIEGWSSNDTLILLEAIGRK